jgi:hypothetical protein
MSNMKRKLTSREFLHGFSKVQADLKPGQTLVITNRGKPMGEFTKASERPKVKMPDFEKIAKSHGYGPEVGDALLKRMLADEAFC